MARSRKEELILELQEQREDLTRRFHSLKEEMHPVHQLQASVRKHPLGWALGTAGSAFLATRLLKNLGRQQNKPRKRRSLVWGGGRLLFTLARPALTNLALNKAREHLESHLGQSSRNSVLGAPSQK
jgi:hypothetical protein